MSSAASARQTRRARARWVAAVLFLALGCGEERAEVDPVSHAADPSEAPVRRVDPPPARVRTMSGTVTLSGAAARQGQAIEAEEVIEVPEGGSAGLALRDGGHVALDGGARARVVTETAAQLFLVRGAAHAVQPPSGSSPRPPLRLVTPAATVEIAASGEVFVAVFDGGSSWVVVLSGAAAVSNGEADARRRLRTVELVAGQAVAVSSRIAEATEGPRRLAEARSAAAALAVPPTEPEAPRLARDIQAEAQRVDQALHWLETETRRGRELTEQHGTAVRGGQANEAQRLQRQLVDHSQALYRLRQLATARWERLRVEWLRLGSLGPLPPTDPVAQRQERVTGLLGL